MCIGVLILVNVCMCLHVVAWVHVGDACMLVGAVSLVHGFGARWCILMSVHA